MSQIQTTDDILIDETYDTQYETYDTESDIINPTQSIWHESRVTILEYDQYADHYIAEKWISKDNDPKAELDRINEIQTYYKDQLTAKLARQEYNEQRKHLDIYGRPIPTRLQKYLQNFKQLSINAFCKISNLFL